jgi:flagellar hook-basal body complex protein FliE
MIQGLAAVEKSGSSLGLEGLANIQAPGAGTVNGAVETSFSQALAGVSENAIASLRGAEGLSLQALQGGTDTREVVDAVMNAEQVLQAAIAIRDKIVSAYLEVNRMSI